MRLDINERESWSAEMVEINSNCKIYLNSEEVKYCTVADEEAGYIECHVVDEHGIFLRDGDEYRIERREGVVSISSPKRAITRVI